MNDSEKKQNEKKYLIHSKTGNTDGTNDVKKISDLIKQGKNENNKQGK